MTEPIEDYESVAANAADTLGRAVTGRAPTPEETEALVSIFRATAQALKHGFIRRMAENVVAERTDEAVEEFFEDEIHTD